MTVPHAPPPAMSGMAGHKQPKTTAMQTTIILRPLLHLGVSAPQPQQSGSASKITRRRLMTMAGIVPPQSVQLHSQAEGSGKDCKLQRRHSNLLSQEAELLDSLAHRCRKA